MMTCSCKDLVDALRKCIGVMVMQEKRESGLFHIRQQVARVMWDDAKDSAFAAIANHLPPPPKLSAHARPDAEHKAEDNQGEKD